MDRHPPPRIAGITVPLFSLHSRGSGQGPCQGSWGVGAITDLVAFAAWIADAGLSLIQLLPLAQGSGASASPYAALSAFGIDPIYLDVEALPGNPPGAALASLGPEDREALAAAQAAPRVEYGAVQRVKDRALRAAFDGFHAREAREQGALGRDFIGFMTENAAWLDNLALFCALKRTHGGAPWWDWPAPHRDRESGALHRVAQELERELLYQKYLQWSAHAQWRDTRRELADRGIELMGDLPFMVDRDSADVWAHRGLFHMEMSVGVPADQFDAEGQDWGMPPYHWEAMAATDFAWLRARCAYAGRLYDRFRIDHLVGFYRTYMRPLHRRRDSRGRLVPGIFSPASPKAQLAHGEQVLQAMIAGARSQGAQLIAEDLGSIPDYVPPSLARLEVPGYKVMIWEKEGAAFVDPKSYPRRSVACFGTHDTEPVAAWWEGLETAERLEAGLLLGLPPAEVPRSFTPAIDRALCERLLAASSELVLLLIQEVLGERTRINTPGTLGDHNWTYRLPAPIENLAADPTIQGRLEAIAAAAKAGGRHPPQPR